MGIVQLPQVVWDSEMVCQRCSLYPEPLDSCELLERHFGLGVFFSLWNRGYETAHGSWKGLCTYFCLCFIIHHFLTGVTGPEHSDSDYGVEKWCMKPIQSCPLRFLGFVCMGHIHLSQVPVFFLSAVSAMSHIYPSSGIAAVVLAEQGACVCRAGRRLQNLDLKCWLYPKRFFLCNWKPWGPGHHSAPRSSGSSE